jgi:hypothetical protein
MVDLTYDFFPVHQLYNGLLVIQCLLGVCLIGYLQGLLCKYPRSDKGRTTHNLYRGLPFQGDLTNWLLSPRGPL